MCLKSRVKSLVSESRGATEALRCPGAAMHDYRVYLLDRQRKIRKATWVQSASLEEAIAQLSSELPETTCEIWDGPRFLATVVPQPSQQYRAG